MTQVLQSIAGGYEGPIDLRSLQFSGRSARGHAAWGGLGDFFDAFALPSGRWGIVVGDARAEYAVQAELGDHYGIAENGVALARAVLRATAQVEYRPTMVLTSANRALLAVPMPDRLQVAVTYATLRPGPVGTWARICMAGSQMAYIRHRNGEVDVLGRPGTPLGARPDPQPFLVRRLLRPGDSLVLVTASVPRVLAGAAAGPVMGFGDDGAAAAGSGRLSEIISELGGVSAPRSTDTILRAVKDAVGGRPGEEVVAVTVKVPSRRRGSGVHAGGWPGTRRYARAAHGGHPTLAALAAGAADHS